MDKVLYNHRNTEPPTNINYNRALYSHMVKILKSENARDLATSIAKTIDWYSKNYPKDSTFGDDVVSILSTLSNGDCLTAFEKLDSVKRDLQQKLRMVDQLFNIGSKVEEIGVAVYSYEGRLIYDPDVEKAMEYFEKISTDGSNSNTKSTYGDNSYLKANDATDGSAQLPSTNLTNSDLDKALPPADKNKSLLERALEHKAHWEKTFKRSPAKESPDTVKQFNEFLKGFKDFKTWEELVKEPVSIQIPDKIKNLGNNNAYSMLCHQLYNIRACGNLPKEDAKDDDIEKYLGSCHDEIRKLNQLYKIYKSQEQNFDNFNIYLPFPDIKDIVTYLNNLFKDYLNQSNITLSSEEGSAKNLMEIIKRLKAACTKLSTLVSVADSLKKSVLFGSIIKKGELSTEINEILFIYKIYKYLEELCAAYSMPKSNKFEKQARKKAINNALNRLNNLLYVMTDDPRGQTIWHKGKKVNALNLGEDNVALSKKLIALLEALKRKT